MKEALSITVTIPVGAFIVTVFFVFLCGVWAAISCSCNRLDEK